jgi:hypothetical protein
LICDGVPPVASTMTLPRSTVIRRVQKAARL